jgi:hypothetical protein
MPNSNASAKTPPPPNVFHARLPGESSALLLEPAVVLTVTVVVAVPSLAIVTLAGFKAQVGRLCALVGEAVSVQARFIVPE